MSTRLFLLALLALIVLVSTVYANEDTDASVDEEEPLDNESYDADDDSDDASLPGILAKAIFTNYPELKVPAGEKSDVLVALTNAPGNADYKAVFVAGHIAPLGDHNRFVQNFSGQVYERTVKPGETATVKYTFTPDALVDPIDYSFVVRVFFQNEDNSTFTVSAYNGTLTVAEPLGTDPKSVMTILILLAIAYGVWTYSQSGEKAVVAVASKKHALETGTSKKAFDPEYVSAEHRAYVDKKKAAGAKTASR